MPEIFTITSLNITEFKKLANSFVPQKIPIEQTPWWGEFDASLPHRTYLGSFRYDEGDRLVAIASATYYQQKGRNWIWIKHGPIFTHSPNTKSIQKMCATLKKQFQVIKKEHPLFIRLELPAVIKQLHMPFEHTMYDQTVVINLNDTQETILANMSQSGRRGIRKAEKAGISVHEIESNDAIKYFEQKYYPLIKETATRDGFGAHPAAYYVTMLEKLQPFVRLYVAEENKTPIAWAITTEYDGSGLYYYGASSAKARELHAPYLLHLEIIKAMKNRGTTSYDFMGIAGKHYPTLANVTQFKLKFSKNIVTVPTTYDLPLQPLKYKLFATAMKAKRGLRH